jgi:dTDP-4-amino-4,6-dideoxygalactose transaminase
MSSRMNMKRVFLSPPDAGQNERALLLEAFDSNWIAPLGPHVDAFEQELAARVGVGNACALSSGTAALHLALILLDIQQGDEVLVSSFTFAATANAIRYVGATPVFIDSDLRTWNMDPELLEEELEESMRKGRLPKAVIVVDLYGQPADYDRIVPVCERYRVALIEDAAEALGATIRGRSAGSFGVMSTLSFNGNKIITTSGGGALLSTESKFTDQARFLATQARDAAPHYQHSHIGYNYRLSNLLAAVGRGQLMTLEQRVEARRAIFERYSASLGSMPGIEFMPEPEGFRSTRWLTCLTVDAEAFGCSREDLRLALEEENIESRPTWKPMHLQPVFTGCRVRGGAVSERIFELGLCLPSGSSLTRQDQERTITTILERRAR